MTIPDPMKYSFQAGLSQTISKINEKIENILKHKAKIANGDFSNVKELLNNLISSTQALDIFFANQIFGLEETFKNDDATISYFDELCEVLDWTVGELNIAQDNLREDPYTSIKILKDLSKMLMIKKNILDTRSSEMWEKIAQGHQKNSII